ncbi:MAG: DUF255 domain-containing protein [Campylobacterota bacterium]
MGKIFIYLMLSIATLTASEIKWAKDFDSGVAEAKKVNKPILFVSSRHSCKYCVILDETTFKDKRVAEELNKNFISIISYSDENDYMPKELWRPGTPAIWFLEPNAEPMYQPLMGAMDAENFLKALVIVKEEFNKEKKKK